MGCGVAVGVGRGVAVGRGLGLEADDGAGVADVASETEGDASEGDASEGDAAAEAADWAADPGGSDETVPGDTAADGEGLAPQPATRTATRTAASSERRRMAVPAVYGGSRDEEPETRMV